MNSGDTNIIRDTEFVNKYKDLVTKNICDAYNVDFTDEVQRANLAYRLSSVNELLESAESTIQGFPIPEDMKRLYLSVYEAMNGNIPRCGFCDKLNKELGLEYATDVGR